jgi:glycosyltransferase involved in cell wall biosynthesis
MDKMRTSWIIPYYNNRDMLTRTLTEWEAYNYNDRQLIKFIIVDDGSKYPALDVIRSWIAAGHNLNFDLRLYRILVDIPWNQDGARNLAMKLCETEWAFMTDVDHLLMRTSVAKFLTFQPRPKTYYMPNQLLTDGTSLERPHPNSYLMRVSDFWSMGGYDEDFAGYYGSDGNFRRCARGAGLVETHTRAFDVVVYRSSDIEDAHTIGLGRKGSPYHVANNPSLMAKRSSPPYKAINPIRFPFERQL